MKRGWNNATACHSVTAWTRLAVPIMLLTFLLLHLYLINIPCSPTCYAVTLPAPLQPPRGNCGPYGTVRTWSSQAEYWFGADIDRICNTPLTSLAWTWCTLTPRACWYEYWFCSFTVLHQYVATSECLLWVVTFLIALVGEWFNDSYYTLLKLAFCVEMYFLPHYHYVIHCWFPFDSGLFLDSEWDAVADTHLFWCLEPCRCAWYCATELSVTLQTSHVWLRFRPKSIHKYKRIY